MRVLVDKVWPLTLGVIAFLVANSDAIAELVSGELVRAGNDFSWKSLLLIAVGFLTMTKTYSKDTARRLAAAPPHDLDTKNPVPYYPPEDE